VPYYPQPHRCCAGRPCRTARDRSSVRSLTALWVNADRLLMAGAWMALIVLTGTGIRDLRELAPSANEALRLVRAHMKTRRPAVRVEDERGNPVSFFQLKEMAELEARKQGRPKAKVAVATDDAIAATMPIGSVGYENKLNEKGERLIWLDPGVVDRLRSLRGPGESYSDVILRLAAEGG
jgi:hypothetical protein